MNTEQSEPTVHYGDDGHSASPAAGESADGAPATAGNGSSNSRRRRRRRKGKGPNPSQPGNQSGAAQGEGEVSGPEQAPAPIQGANSGAVPSAIQSSGAPASPAQNGAQNSHNQGGKRKSGRKRSGAGGGGGNPQPGNGQPRQQRQGRQNNGGWRRGGGGEGPDGNREGARGGFGSEHFQDANGNAGGRRKGKFGRKAPAGFVGPMDHSYRTVNGNVADGPPSTMDYRSANGNSNGNMSSRSDYAEVEKPQTVREDAPVRIICFIEDLFIVTKMNETARKMGVKLQFAKAEKETLAAITDGPEAERPALIIFDLNNAAAKPLTLIPKLKAKLKRSTSIIGFLQHVQGDLKMKAVEAGCDTVIPRSAFSLSLPNLLRRYGFTEEEELAEA